MTKLYVFDLDGTLANIDHRLPYIKKKPKDWKSFMAGIDNDLPVSWVIDLLKLCRRNGEILILTGRNEESKKQTDEWLIDNYILYDYLLMRSKKDYRADTITKPEKLDKFLRDKDFEVQFIVEDKQDVVDKWRELGYNVLQCDKWDE